MKTDSFISDLRRHEAEESRQDAIDAKARQHADWMMQKGEQFDPFCPTTMMDMLDSNDHVVHALGTALHAGDHCEAGRILAEACRHYVRQDAVDWAYEAIKREWL